MALWIGPAIIAALVSGLIGIVGLIVNGIVSIRLEQGRRHEKIRDFQIAVRAEIRSELTNLLEYDLDMHLADVISKYQHSNTYAVRASQPARSIVFDIVLSEIHILPEAVIDPVILYARQLHSIEQFANELREPDFAKRKPETQIAMYSDYIAMKKVLLVMARNAIDTPIQQ